MKNISKAISLLLVSAILVGCSSAEQIETQTDAPDGTTLQAYGTETANVAVQTETANSENEPDKPKIIADIHPYELDAAISMANLVLTATLVSSSSDSINAQLIFEPVNILKGSYETSVMVNYPLAENHINGTDISYITADDDFSVGNTYFLVLEYNDSVYLDEPYYTLLYRGIIEMSDSNVEAAELFGREIQFDYSTQTEMVSAVSSIVDTSVVPEYYTQSNDEEVIKDECGYIARITVDSIAVEGDTNRNTWYCTVVDAIKGNISGTVMIPFFKDTVEAGETYTVCLNGDDNGKLYTLSSRNSILDE